MEKTVWRQLAAKGFARKSIVGKLWLCLGLSILVNLECPVGKMITMFGALYWWISIISWETLYYVWGSHPLSRSFSFSWSPGRLLSFFFHSALNSKLTIQRFSLSTFHWISLFGALFTIHHLILFSTHQLLSFFFPKLQNVNLHIQFIFDLCIFYLWVNEFIEKRGWSLDIYTFPLKKMT